MTERVVIQHFDGYWKVISRARLMRADHDGRRGLTPAGQKLTGMLADVEGIVGGVVGDETGYGVDFRTVHEALWTWDDVEPAVLDAYRRALGTDDLDVVREDKTGGGGNP